MKIGSVTKIIMKLAWCLLILGSVQGHLRLDPLVDTNQGLIKGLKADDGDYSMFLGIPFARVDEENPFGAAQPYPKFEQIFEAYDDSRICPQIQSSEVTGTLDCLRLNVFVPNEASTRNKVPVLVWIHGGGFIDGSGTRTTSDPKYLIRHDVIVVTINYRLGPYGFMCLDDPEVQGNQGLKDQTLALRWIKENIESFGGDTNKITVYGESAGSISVESHIASKNENLFNQAILSSGSIYGRGLLSEIDNSAPLKISKQLGYETDDAKVALQFLKQTDVKLVIAAAHEIGIRLGVCVENESEGAFLTEHPSSISTLPKARNMAILSGYDAYETLGMYYNQPAEHFSNIDPFKDYLDQFGLEDDKYDAAYKAIRRFYIGDYPISINTKWGIIKFTSDVTFNHPTVKSIKRFNDSGVKNQYFYVFAYTGKRNLLTVKGNIKTWGAAHGDELGYIFDMDILDKDVNERDQVILDRMTSYWTNFVKYGNPTPKETELLPMVWPTVTEDSLNYLHINTNEYTDAAPNNERHVFWEVIEELYLK